MRAIGVFDSGIGGLTVLESLKQSLPHESFIYYGDSLHNPYGEKSDEELYILVKNVVEFLLRKDVKLIVIACNTATTKCIKKLRNEYPFMTFVGMVPAIKLACDNSYKNTLVMATPATINSESTSELIHDFKKNNQVVTLLPCPNLAHLIELGDKEKVRELLSILFKDYQDINFDAIVLGCTHYPIIKDDIKSFYPGSVILDGTEGVVKEVKRQLKVHDLLNDFGKQQITIYNSLNTRENTI